VISAFRLRTCKFVRQKRAAGRRVTMNDAIVAFAQMIAFIADNRAGIAKRYGP